MSEWMPTVITAVSQLICILIVLKVVWRRLDIFDIRLNKISDMVVRIDERVRMED